MSMRIVFEIVLQKELLWALYILETLLNLVSKDKQFLLGGGLSCLFDREILSGSSLL